MFKHTFMYYISTHVHTPMYTHKSAAAEGTPHIYAMTCSVPLSVKYS